MLCLQTSCHRCPSALHNRLVTSTPPLFPLSLIHHVRLDASSITAAPQLACRANRGRRAKNAGVATGRAAAATCRWRKNASSITATPALAAMAYWPGRARDRRVARKTNLPHRYAAAATRPLVTVTGIVSLNYPQKKTPPSQSLAQLRPVDRLHAHRLELRRVRAPHDPQHDIAPDLRLLDQG